MNRYMRVGQLSRQARRYRGFLCMAAFLHREQLIALEGWLGHGCCWGTEREGFPCREELAAHWGLVDLSCCQDIERVGVLHMGVLWLRLVTWRCKKASDLNYLKS